MMGSRLCKSCVTNWPYRQRFFTCPYCGGPTMWSSAHAMPSDDADRLLRGLIEFRAHMRHLEAVVAETGFDTAEVFAAQRHRRAA